MTKNNNQADIYVSTCGDVWANQGFEQLLYRDPHLCRPLLYLWQNNNCVVIGRRQNAWKECDWKKLEADGGKLARRISGGGAVYHDPGNLNFTLIMPRRQYDQEQINTLLLTALRSLQITAIQNGRNDLTAAGKKFSGHAFAFSTAAALHHGTILVDCDFARLGDFLSPDQQKIRAKGISSVRSRVINLRQLQPTLTIEQVKQALIQQFIQVFGMAHPQTLDTATQVPSPTYAHFASWAWRFGEAPPFEIDLEQRFSWGNLQLCLAPKNGFIAAARAYSDALDEEFISLIEQTLPGLEYRYTPIAQALTALGQRCTTSRQQQITAVVEWLTKELL
ncbi:MAG: lipoate--protein ligase [Clostridiales bacterium]